MMWLNVGMVSILIVAGFLALCALAIPIVLLLCVVFAAIS